MDSFLPGQDTLPLLTSAKKDASYLYKNIGPYRVDALWKKGSLSHLYLATDLKHHRSCVLKILSPDLLKLPEMVDQFLKESEIISMIKHPNIVSVFDTGQWEQGFYIAMQYLQGISLKQFLTHHKLTPVAAVNITLKVAYALLHLHTHSIIHRDIKPENILILDTGEIKLIDFGIAKLEGETPIGLEKKSPSIIGTPNYMSPEQKKNPLRVTYQSDIYSLGMVLQELLLGKMCHGKNQTNLIDEPFQSVVKKATQLHLDDRFEDIVDFIQSLTLSLKSSPQTSASKAPTSRYASFKSFNDPTPRWPLIDIGMSEQKLNDTSSFYRFLSFQNNSYAFLYCVDANNNEDPTSVLLMKGYLENSFLKHKEHGITPPKFLDLFFEAKKHFSASTIHFTYLHLTPRLSRAAFISSHFGPFFMIKAGRDLPQKLASSPLASSDIVQTTQHWKEGDVLSLHSFSMDNVSPLTPPSCGGLKLDSAAHKLYNYLVSKSSKRADHDGHMVISFEHLG